MAQEWSKFDDIGLARFVITELPDSFQLPNRVNRLELIQWDKKQLLEEIYKELLAKNIKYALEPFNSQRNTQLIRTYKEILDTRAEGTCLDLAILFCGICLAYDLLPLLIILEDHALAAVSMRYLRQEYWNDKSTEREKERQLFQDKPISDYKKLQELINSGSFLPIECTGFVSSQTTLPEHMPEGIGRNQDGFLSFERAIEAGKEQINTSGRKFNFAIDIAIAHEYWNIKQPSTQSNNRPPVHQILFEGYNFLSNNDLDKAERKFDEAQKLKKELPEPWYWKAQLALAKGNSLVALRYINKALQLNPSYLHGLYFKIKLLLIMGGNCKTEAQELTNEIRGKFRDLDLWLNCLQRENLLANLVTTNTELDCKCPPPRYEW